MSINYVGTKLQLTGILYLATGLIALYWTVQKTLVGMYGAPFSWWYTIVALGAALLILSAVMFWISARPETLWLLRFGSGLLVVYFIPSIVITMRQYIHSGAASLADLILPAVMVLLGILSFVWSVIGVRAG